MRRMALAKESFDITVTLQMLSIGRECIFAFIPFEVLTLTGNKLEEMFAAAGFPREAIYICAYANSVEGYLAPAEEFEHGGYEVYKTKFARGTAEFIVDQFLDMLNDMYNN